MRIVKIIFPLSLLAGLYITASKGFSQSNTIEPKRNLIEISYFDGYFLEGSINAFKDFGLGLDFIHFFKEKRWGVEIASRIWGGSKQLPEDTIILLPPGVKIETQTIFVSGSFFWPILEKEKLKLYGLSDLTFRGGFEDIVVKNHITSGGWPEMIGQLQPQRDLGISLGSKISFFPIRRIALSADLRYTRFLYRYFRGNPAYTFDNGTTKNLLSLQVKLGFCF